MRLVLLLSLTLSVFAHAAKIDGATFEHLQQRVSEIPDVYSEAALDVQLESVEQNVQVLLINRYLAKMTQVDVASAEQRVWVESLLSDARQLSIAHPDHPNKHAHIVSVAGAAKTLLAIWDMKSLALEMGNAFQRGEYGFLYTDETSPSLDVRALNLWISGISVEQAQLLIYLLQDNDILRKSVSMATLAGLYEKTNEHLVLAYMLDRGVDHHVIRAFQLLPTRAGAESAVAALSLGLSHKALQSQSLMLLARHYDEHPKAQSLLISAINDPKLAWHAASVMKLIDDKSFRKRISETIGNSELDAHEFARKALSEEVMQ